jgi:CheY-like chemotaxis protein
MVWNIKQNELEGGMEVHQYYMDIINCMPNIVYWIDTDCFLKGCNLNFFRLLGLQQHTNFAGTPYDHMSRQLPWGAERIESLKLSDMAVLFSGIPEHDVEESPVYNSEGKATYYYATRVPLFDMDKNTTGLVVILSDVTAQKKLEKTVGYVPATSAHTVHPHPDKPVRVLLVEDNIVAQHIQQALFVSLNCDVDIAGSGDAADMLFEPGKYDIVFMDIGLQDTSGYIVSKTFREMEKNTRYHVPIIALTSYQADVVKDDCNDYFMEGVMTKPLTREQALKIIKQHVYHEVVEIM